MHIFANRRRPYQEEHVLEWKQPSGVAETSGMERQAKLKDEVTIAKPLVGLDVSHFRFLLLGPIGSGKSSFINTVNAAISGRVTQRASCGTSHHSVTTTYTPYTYRNCSGSSLHLKLCDTPGLEPTQGIDVTDCRFLLNGHVPEFYTFNPSVHFGLDSHEFRVKSTADAKVHCAVFVIDASTVDHMSEKLVDTMTSFKKIMFEKGVPQAVLLTKIDTVSDTVDEDVSRVFNCADIEQKVKKASEVLGLPRNSVFPVKNYEHEIDGDRNVDILALVALRQLLYFAMDYLENQKMQQNKTGDSVRLQCGLWCVPAKKR
ncbi:IFI44-like protein [Mya arenaria]|uniref:IFI44-like protein n=1 Tax=Mya arenaria TaxID=6604 RepID=A0ABY7FTQ4_MYAAR|nr:IFI44-like protein [Mya arenaria]